MKKDLIQIATVEMFLNRTDIQTLCGCSRRVANRIYAEADRIDNEELKFRAYITKVRKSSVEKAAGIKCSDIVNALKKADALAQQSASD